MTPIPYAIWLTMRVWEGGFLFLFNQTVAWGVMYVAGAQWLSSYDNNTGGLGVNMCIFESQRMREMSSRHDRPRPFSRSLSTIRFGCWGRSLSGMKCVCGSSFRRPSWCAGGSQNLVSERVGVISQSSVNF
jgi:hypothetical protein